MTFETASIIFMTTGTALFIAILLVKHPHIVLSLVLAMASILWSVMALKYWGVTFPQQYSWVLILFPILGIVSAMNILTKSKKI